MGQETRSNSYVLGNADVEHDRLIRQAEMLAPCTRRAFLDAGLAPGQQVLDIGSGMGDVAMLAASLVGPSGTVMGIDRDESSLAKARERAVAGHIANLRYITTDLSDPKIDGSFDAIVGRFILMFLGDPGATVRRLAERLRPGGVMVFQEPSWSSLFPMAAHLPLHTHCANLMCEVLRRSGARPNMAEVLHRDLLGAGLTDLNMRVEVVLATLPRHRRWLADLLATVRSRIEELGMPHDSVGDLETIGSRLEQEFQVAGSFMPFIGLVSAWARKPLT